jgi:hypothetical protein
MSAFHPKQTFSKTGRAEGAVLHAAFSTRALVIPPVKPPAAEYLLNMIRDVKLAV